MNAIECDIVPLIWVKLATHMKWYSCCEVSQGLVSEGNPPSHLGVSLFMTIHRSH